MSCSACWFGILGTLYHYWPLQTRLDEKEAAERRATTSESEAAELSKRLVELKMGEIERMNEASPLPESSVACMRQAGLITCSIANTTLSPHTCDTSGRWFLPCKQQQNTQEHAVPLLVVQH